MRGEGETDGRAGDLRELLLDLRRVTVDPADFVRADALGRLGQVGGARGIATRAAHAALRVHDDPCRLDQSIAEQGRERQDAGGGVAARNRDEIGGGERGAMELDQAISSLSEEIGRAMLAVPARVHRGITQAKVGAEIEDRAIASAQGSRHGRAMPVGEREEREIRGVRDGVGVEVGDLPVEDPREGRKDVGDPCAGGATTTERPELKVGMGEDATHQLAACIPCRSDDRRAHGAE